MFQIFAYMTYTAAFGLGIWLALPVSGGHYIDSYLLLAGNSPDGEIAYGVVAGVMWVTWVAAAIWGEMRRKKAAKLAEQQRPEKLTGERRQSDNSRSDGSDTDLNGHYRPAKEQQA